MTASDFTYLLQHPQNLNADQVGELENLIDAHPYFQPARALYLKGLKAINSKAYNGQLKKTAAYTTDRSILFDYITSEVFNQNDISQIIKQNSESLKDIKVNELEDISVNRSVTIDDALKQHIRNTEGVLDPQLFEQKVKEEAPANFASETSVPIESVILEVDAKNIEKTPEETLQIGKPLEFDKNETHSFAEWLKITSFKPIDRTDDSKAVPEETQSSNQTEDTAAPLQEKYRIIDKFLSSNAKIIPSKEAPKKPLVLTEETQNEGLMTETLARIYLEQNNYEKAIQSYKILSLKYPEKSGFFADQIKAVKKLQENNIQKQ